MGKWVRIPCGTCDETGKLCDQCGGGSEMYCDCADNDDDCPECHGSGVIECKECTTCSNCDGKGYTEVFLGDCPECGGDGTAECDCAGGLGTNAADQDCCACGGSGTHVCPVCNGTGFDLEDSDVKGIDISCL